MFISRALERRAGWRQRSLDTLGIFLLDFCDDNYEEGETGACHRENDNGETATRKDNTLSLYDRFLLPFSPSFNCCLLASSGPHHQRCRTRAKIS